MIISNARFAYRRSDAEVRADFDRLRNARPEDLVESSSDWEVRTGCPTPRKVFLFRNVRMGQYLSERMHWKHRVRTGTIWWKSGQDTLERLLANRETLRNTLERIRNASRKTMTPDELLYEAVRTNSALMTLTHFRTSVSKYLCDVLEARTVLDFSAGWGDRLTGFLASEHVTDITLIDPRPGSISACKRQHAFVRSPARLVTYQRGAEDVVPTLPSHTYDLVVSSPPYFNIEHYGETPAEARGQIRTKVDDVDGYLRVFLRPVLTHSARVLKRGGVLAINVDDNVRTNNYLCKPTLDILNGIPALKFVGTAGLRKGSGFGQFQHTKTRTKAEPIYLFEKR